MSSSFRPLFEDLSSIEENHNLIYFTLGFRPLFGDLSSIQENLIKLVQVEKAFPSPLRGLIFHLKYDDYMALQSVSVPSSGTYLPSEAQLYDGVFECVSVPSSGTYLPSAVFYSINAMKIEFPSPLRGLIFHQENRKSRET